MRTSKPGGTAIAYAVLLSASLWVHDKASDPPETALAIPECPFNKSEASLLVDVGEIAEIPEFHDCQRLMTLTPDGPRYDSLYALFSLKLQSRVWGLINANPPHQWRLSGIVHAGGKYADLGIGPGINCLYIANEGDRQRPRLKAKMLQNRNVWRCPNPLTVLAGPITDLEVRRYEIAGFNPDTDFPTAARWEWDADHGVHYMGISCGGWCEVGKANFTAAAAYPFADGGVPTPKRRVTAIHGWYDEQPLAVSVAGELRPGGLRGTAFPDPKLGTRELGDYSTGKWYPAARIAFPGDNPLYVAKLNFQVTPPPQPMTNSTWDKLVLIDLCKGTSQQCEDVPDDTPCGYWSPSTSAPTSGEAWWARIKRQGDPAAKYKCVWRMDHSEPGIPRIPGTVRWRWHATDETIWMRCGQGCCEVDS